MSDSPRLITRREALKKGAIAGGAVLWAVPVVQTLGMGRAFAATPSDQCVSSWSTAVSDSDQGPTRSGGAFLSGRSDPGNALGAPDDDFFSLGFGGYIVLQFGTPYYSGKNGEALVVETTGGTYPLEEADVFVGESATPAEWKYVGTAKNTGSPALQKSLDSIVGLPGIITHLKIVDISDEANFPYDPPDDVIYADADGFDVNAAGIGCP